MKKAPRLIEKAVFSAKLVEDASGARAWAAPSYSCVKDVNRAMVALYSIGGIAAFVEAVRLEAAHVRVVRFKDRFAQPSAGWRDCVLSLVCVSDEREHICELQVTHVKMRTARVGFGGHMIYSICRNATEFKALKLQLTDEGKQPLPADVQELADRKAVRLPLQPQPKISPLTVLEVGDPQQAEDSLDTLLAKTTARPKGTPPPARATALVLGVCAPWCGFCNELCENLLKLHNREQYPAANTKDDAQDAVTDVARDIAARPHVALIDGERARPEPPHPPPERARAPKTTPLSIVHLYVCVCLSLSLMRVSSAELSCVSRVRCSVGASLLAKRWSHLCQTPPKGPWPRVLLVRGGGLHESDVCEYHGERTDAELADFLGTEVAVTWLQGASDKKSLAQIAAARLKGASDATFVARCVLGTKSTEDDNAGECAVNDTTGECALTEGETSSLPTEGPTACVLAVPKQTVARAAGEPLVRQLAAKRVQHYQAYLLKQMAASHVAKELETLDKAWLAVRHGDAAALEHLEEATAQLAQLVTGDGARQPARVRLEKSLQKEEEDTTAPLARSTVASDPAALRCTSSEYFKAVLRTFDSLAATAELRHAEPSSSTLSQPSDRDVATSRVTNAVPTTATVSQPATTTTKASKALKSVQHHVRAAKSPQPRQTLGLSILCSSKERQRAVSLSPGVFARRPLERFFELAAQRSVRTKAFEPGLIRIQIEIPSRFETRVEIRARRTRL